MAFVHARAKGWPVEQLAFVPVGNLAGAVDAFAGGTADVFFWEKFMTKPLVDAEQFRRVAEFTAPWPAFVVCVADAVAGELRAAIMRAVALVLAEAQALRTAPDAAAVIAQRYGLAAADVAEWLTVTRWSSRVGVATDDLGPACAALGSLGVLPRALQPPTALRPSRGRTRRLVALTRARGRAAGAYSRPSAMLPLFRPGRLAVGRFFRGSVPMTGSKAMRSVGSLVVLASVCLTGPSFGQASFAGVWNMTLTEDFPDRLPGPELGDYAGLPLNAADRARAQSWSATILSLPDYQCRVHPSDYANSFADIRMWHEINTTTQELVAIHIQHFAWNTPRTIWMDGRPHPPEMAEHTSMGFSTGEWVGNTLKVTTTHLKEGWLRRNGVARSDARRSPSISSVTATTSPGACSSRIRSTSKSRSSAIATTRWPRTARSVRIRARASSRWCCRSRATSRTTCPGDNPFLIEYARNHKIPFEAAMGGAATMYPEYRKKMAELPQP